MVSHGSAIVATLTRCACSSSIDFSGPVFAFHGLGLLLHVLWSIYNISAASNSSDTALTHLNDLVCHFRVIDTYRSQVFVVDVLFSIGVRHSSNGFQFHKAIP